MHNDGIETRRRENMRRNEILMGKPLSMSHRGRTCDCLVRQRRKGARNGGDSASCLLFSFSEFCR